MKRLTKLVMSGRVQSFALILGRVSWFLGWLILRYATVSMVRYLNQPSGQTQPGHPSVGRRCVLAMVSATTREVSSTE